MRIRNGWVLVCVGLVVLTCSVVEAKDNSGIKTILVDCDKGDSINKALEEKADEIIIKISGMCQENVYVTRDSVTLRGSDPAVDGIRAESEEDTALLIANARGFKIENLMLTGGDFGLEIDHSVGYRGVEVVGCKIENNSVGGALFNGSRGTASDTTFSSNVDFGLVASMGSSVTCIRCTFADQFDGVDAANSRLVLRDSQMFGIKYGISALNSWVSVFGDANTIGALDAILAFHDSRIGVSGTVSGAASAFGGSTVAVGGTLAGSINVSEGSVVKMSGTQISNPDGNVVRESSFLTVDGGATLVGTTTLSDFSTASIKGSTVDGDLICDSGADAYCDGASTVAGTSTCGQCPKP